MTELEALRIQLREVAGEIEEYLSRSIMAVESGLDETSFNASTYCQAD